MAKKMTRAKHQSFADFIAEPPISTALLVFALIALMLSILEFQKALSF